MNPGNIGMAFPDIKQEFPDIKQEFPDIKQEFPDIKQELLDPATASSMGKPGKKKKTPQPKKLKQEKITDHVQVKKKRKIDRFKGMSEEEVQARLLPDHLAPNLDIVIVGINPGLYAAFVGHHYAGPGNHFWKCLFLSGLIPEQMNASQDFKLLEYGIGFTNIVARTTRGSADLSKKEIKEGGEILREKLLKYKPKIAVFNGKGIYEVFVGHKNFYFGKQPEPLLGTETAVFVMPSSSARCSQLPRAVDKVPFYAALRKYRDHLIGKIPDLDDSEITFPDLELKTVKKEVKKEEPEDVYPSESMNMAQHSIDNNLSQFMPGSYQVIPHSLTSSAAAMPQISESQGVISSQFQLPHIKQEPGTIPEMSSCLSNVTHTTVPNNAVSSSMNYANGQSLELCSPLPVSSEQAGSSQSVNSFLHGLYGLVNQVAATTASSSKYGVVHQPGPSHGNRPMQFNDALCDIVSEGGSFDVEPEPPQEIAPEPKSKGKKSAAKAPRKRKSKSSLDEPSQDDGAAMTSSPPHFQPWQQSSSDHPNSAPMSQSVPAYGHPHSGMAHFPGFPQPPHTQPPFTSMPTLSQSLHPLYNHAGAGYHPAVGNHPLAPSFTQMMGTDLQDPRFPVHTTHSGHVFQNGGAMSHNGQMYPPYYLPTSMASSQGHEGFNPNMPIKQEKPDTD